MSWRKLRLSLEAVIALACGVGGGLYWGNAATVVLGIVTTVCLLHGAAVSE